MRHIKIEIKSPPQEVDANLKLPYLVRGLNISTKSGKFNSPFRTITQSDFSANSNTRDLVDLDSQFAFISRKLDFNDVKDLGSNIGFVENTNFLKKYSGMSQHSTMRGFLLRPTESKKTISKDGKEQIMPPGSAAIKKTASARKFYEILIDLAKTPENKEEFDLIGFPYMYDMEKAQHLNLIKEFLSKADDNDLEPVFFLDPRDENKFNYLLTQLANEVPTEQVRIIGLYYRSPRESYNSLKLIQRYQDLNAMFLIHNVPRSSYIKLSGVHGYSMLMNDAIAVEYPHGGGSDDSNGEKQKKTYNPRTQSKLFFKSELSVLKLQEIKSNKEKYQELITHINSIKEERLKNAVLEVLSFDQTKNQLVSDDEISGTLKVLEHLESSEEMEITYSRALSNEAKNYVNVEKPLLAKWVKYVDYDLRNK